MKKQKIKFVIEQILLIILYNYFILFDSYFIYGKNLLPTFLIMMTFFNLGTFSSLYFTLMTKSLTKEKESFLFDYNCTIYMFSIFLCLFHNCTIISDQLMTHYFVGMYMLLITVSLMYEAYTSYKRLKSTQLIFNV